MELPTNLSRYAVPGASESQLVTIEGILQLSLPRDFREFLLTSDGLSVDGGFLIYGSEDLVERNETWEVSEYAPGYVAIGDNGGGDVFLMKLSDNEAGIYMVESGVMDPEFMEQVAKSLEEWMKLGLPAKAM